MAKSEFGERLKAAFGNATNAVIGNKIGVSEGAVGFYVRGRIPDADTLVKIANATDCNLHWLLTGEGDRSRSARVDLDQTVRDIIREIVREEIEALSPGAVRVMPLELGSKSKKTRKTG